MKTLLLMLTIGISSLVSAQSDNNLYQFKVTAIDGSEVDLSKYKGMKVLLVNTASKCGFTPQYEDLEKLYKTYADSQFVILGFPANNFMKQEPGSNEEIAEFCQINYGVTFPMMAKISVKGSDIHPLYKWLTQETNSKVQWNFQKYMINSDGSIAGYVSSRTLPFDETIINWIEGN